MKDELITFETANLAEKKNYPFEWVVIDNEKVPLNMPTQSVLHKWLREKHGIYICIIPTVTASWTFKTITVISERDSDLPPYKNVSGEYFSTYEEALETGLLEVLSLIKNNE
jgi:hypothetical protein